MLFGLDTVLGPAIVKTRVTNHSKADFSTNGFRPTNERMAASISGDRHEIRNLSDALARKKSGQQNIGIGEIQLPPPFTLHDRRQFETAPFPIIQQGRENGGRI